MSAGFRDDLITKRIVASDTESFDGLLRKVSRRKPSSNIESLHVVAVISTNFHAFSGHVNSSTEGAGPVLA